MTTFEKIHHSNSTFLIAEIGSNHNGKFDLALELMDIAAKAGANAVKFQSFLADHLVKPSNPDYEMLKKIELPREWYPKLKKEADDRGLVFFSTATNEITLGWLVDAGVDLFKIASPNLTHIPLIRKVSTLGRATIMSTGMARLVEIDEAVREYTAGGNEQLCLLHCISDYPANPKDINLRAIQTLQAIYPYPVGFSDHTAGIATTMGAVALGAKIIEKHLTLDRKMVGPDHHYSLEPSEFLAMGEGIRVVEQALGNGHKNHVGSDRGRSNQYWRSIHASRDLPAGTVLQESDLSIVRPNDGLAPRHVDDLLGLKLQHSLRAGDGLSWKAFKL
jgi:N,N'-diacetyllegionaminate synthase